MASSYSSILSDCLTTGPSQSSPMALEVGELRFLHARAHPRAVEVFHAHQEARPAERANSHASRRRPQVSEMERAGGARCEASIEAWELDTYVASLCRARSRKASQSLQPLSYSVCFPVEQPQRGQERYYGGDHTNEEVCRRQALAQI